MKRKILAILISISMIMSVVVAISANGETGVPSADPSAIPSAMPSWQPSENPSANPSVIPSDEPSVKPKPVLLKKIKLNKKKVTLRVGKKFKLKLTYSPKKGLSSTEKKVKFSSSDKYIAKVNSKGEIKARHKGKCKIIVTGKHKVKAVCKIKVNPKKLYGSVLGKYHTTFSTDTENNRNRKWNMEKACKTINGLVVKSGETFSFNGVVGPRSKKTGYKPAGAYRNGENTTEYGGGICQCSTTMYNAVLRADLKVVYRKNHSFTVPYTAIGTDATVSHPEVDFKWKNNTAWPIKIKAYVDGNTIYVKLLGTRPKGVRKKVKISTKILETREKPVQYVYGSQYPESGVVIQSGHTGYTAQSFKTIYINGKLKVSNKLIATSYYNTMPMIIGKRGNKK